jgi:ribosomal protein L24
MSLRTFCHIKKGDTVVVLTGDHKKSIGNVLYIVKKDHICGDRFFVALSSLKKKSIRDKRTKKVSEKDILIDSSNVKLIKAV